MTCDRCKGLPVPTSGPCIAGPCPFPGACVEYARSYGFAPGRFPADDVQPDGDACMGGRSFTADLARYVRRVSRVGPSGPGVFAKRQGSAFADVLRLRREVFRKLNRQ